MGSMNNWDTHNSNFKQLKDRLLPPLEAREQEHERNRSLAKDPYFDYGDVLLQIAIVLSSVAILSSSRRMFGLSLAIASLGLLNTLNGFTLLFGAPTAS